MPSVEELLSVAEADADTRSTMDSRIEIDADTRIIQMMPQDELFGVESDEKSERKYFKVPKIVGNGVDLSKLQLRINYQNASKIPSGKDMYIVTDATVYNDEWVYFSWELSRKVTQYKGSIYFIVCATKADSNGNITNEWNTTLAEGKVLEGLEVETSQEQQYQASDYLEQLKQQLLEYSKEIKDTFPSDYTQIQDDIGSLKGDLNELKTYVYDVEKEPIEQKDTSVKSNKGKLEYANSAGLTTYTYEINKYPTKVKISGTIRGASTWLAVTATEDGTLVDRVNMGTTENITYQNVELTITNKLVKTLVVTVISGTQKDVFFSRSVAICYKSEYDSEQDAKIIDIKKSWIGKKAVCFGDSLTYGDNGLGNGTTGKQITWVTYLPDLCGFSEAINLGYKGSTVAHYEGEQSPCFIDRLDTLVDGELFVVMGGVNDHMKNIPLGDIGNGDNSTFIGALETVVNYMKSNYPSAELLMCSSPKYIYNSKNSFWRNSQGLYQKDYADATKLVADKYSCDFLDLFNNSGISPFVDAQKSMYMSDGLHYLENGYKKLAETRICPKINSMLIN